MRFNGICVVTKDVSSLSDFYCRVLDTHASGNESFALLATEGAEFSIFSEAGMERMAPGATQDAGRGCYTIEFEVCDVDEEYARLMKLGVKILKQPTTQSWGRRSVWFTDPDGNIVNFYKKVVMT